MSHGIPQKESDLLKQIRYILDVLQTTGVLQYWRMNTGPTVVRGKFFPNKQSIGFSDLLILIKNGPTLFVELKTKTGKLSEAQRHFERRINCAGGDRRFVVWRDLEQAQKELNEFLQMGAQRTTSAARLHTASAS